MTVEDLIKELESMPQDKKVFIYDDEGHCCGIGFIFIDKDGDVGIRS